MENTGDKQVTMGKDGDRNPITETQQKTFL